MLSLQQQTSDEESITEYIYARVSTDKQEHDAQLAELKARWPRARVIEEIASGAKARPLLDALIKNMQAGDTLIVYALDRLGRRALDIMRLVEGLRDRNINFISHKEGMDINRPAGRLVMNVLASVAEMERERISERTKAGLAAAAKKGRKGGRKKQITADVVAACHELRDKGWSYRRIANKMGISLGSVQNALKQTEDTKC